MQESSARILKWGLIDAIFLVQVLCQGNVLFDNPKPPPADLATGLDEMNGDLTGEAER
jgi:hypothetical protein